MPLQQSLKCFIEPVNRSYKLRLGQDNAKNDLCVVQVELAAWTGPDFVKTLLLKDMPDLMRKDTEKLIDESPPGKKQPQRFTRQEAARRAAAALDTVAASPGKAAQHPAAQSAGEAAEEEDMVGS